MWLDYIICCIGLFSVLYWNLWCVGLGYVVLRIIISGFEYYIARFVILDWFWSFLTAFCYNSCLPLFMFAACRAVLSSIAISPIYKKCQCYKMILNNIRVLLWLFYGCFRGYFTNIFWIYLWLAPTCGQSIFQHLKSPYTHLIFPIFTSHNFSFSFTSTSILHQILSLFLPYNPIKIVKTHLKMSKNISKNHSERFR